MTCGFTAVTESCMVWLHVPLWALRHLVAAASFLGYGWLPVGRGWKPAGCCWGWAVPTGPCHQVAGVAQPSCPGDGRWHRAGPLVLPRPLQACVGRDRAQGPRAPLSPTGGVVPASGFTSPGASPPSAKEARWVETAPEGQLRASVSLCGLVQPFPFLRVPAGSLAKCFALGSQGEELFPGVCACGSMKHIAAAQRLPCPSIPSQSLAAAGQIQAAEPEGAEVTLTQHRLCCRVPQCLDFSFQIGHPHRGALGSPHRPPLGRPYRRTHGRDAQC